MLHSQHNHWHRLRWQMAWGLLAAVAPFLMRFLILGPEATEQGISASANAMWGGILAIFMGIFLIRNVGRYPGVEKTAAIIPSFSIAFGLLIAALLMLRLDYSRWVLSGAYFSVIAIFYLGYSQVFGRKRLRIGIIAPISEADALQVIRGVDWNTLTAPDASLEGIDAVAVDLRMDLPPAWEQRIADLALANIPVYHSKHLIESLTGRVELEHLSETSYGTLSPPEVYMVPKSILDRIVAAIALIVLAPFLAVVAGLIRLDSPGAAIFRQERVGFRGKSFTVYKFRTMHLRQEQARPAREDAITQENDCRITRLGKFLRRSRIDELPQIFNILKGEMSWIGPRPEAAVLSKWYENEIPFYRYRHVVRPGVTGWAQVMQGHVADISNVRNKLYYDFYYIKNFSLWLDILIVVRTIRTMLTGFGAK